MKYDTFREFSAQNIFVKKRKDENFSHKLFGIEINANENKANYGISLFQTVAKMFHNLIHNHVADLFLNSSNGASNA